MSSAATAESRSGPRKASGRITVRPQPAVELHLENPGDFRRIELGVCVQLPAPQAKEIARYLSAQSGYPWSNLTWLGPGHTIPADVFADLSGNRFPYALLSAYHPAVESPQFPFFRDDLVRVLWMIPISEAERDFAMEHSGDELFHHLSTQHGPGLASLTRPESSL